MDRINKLGGRKFLMALVVTGIATFLEMNNPSGLTPTMAAFLAGIVGTFSIANYAASAKHMDSRQSSNGGNVTEKLDQVLGLLSSGVANPETLNSFLSVLNDTKNDLNQVKASTGQIGQAVINLTKK